MAAPLSSCRLYLLTPTHLDPQAFAPALAATLEAGDTACVELALADADDAAWRAAIAALRPVVQARDAAFLLNGHAELAAATGCDGVRLDGSAGQASARQALGADAIVGVAAGTSRHDAMVAGERDADFIGLGPGPDGGPDLDLVAWWAELMEVPCVAFGIGSAADAAAAAAAGADFIAAGDAVWAHPAGPAAGVRALLAAVATAREAAD